MRGSTTHDATVPLSALQGLGLHEVERDGHDDGLPVTFIWTPGSPPTGLSGPPENYDPGEGDEFVLVSPAECSCDAEELIIGWLDANWQRPEDDGPDPDDLRDRMIDDRLTGDA